jgi:hypothetical protein
MGGNYTSPARSLLCCGSMTDNLEDRVSQLEDEVRDLRRRIEAFEKTISRLYQDLRSRDEAFDIAH